MKILFITAHPYLPQMFGGLQSSTDEFCQSLVLRGHKVSVFCGLIPNGWLGFSSRLKIKINKILFNFAATSDRALGYKIWRAWFPWEQVTKVVRKECPDLIVVLAAQPVRMALAAIPTGIPVLIQLQDVEFSQHGGDFKLLGNINAVANSNFTARIYHEAYGISPAVIYPFIALDKYRTITSRENVTFINPHEFKGLNIALNVAKLCPSIPFVFVESWPLKQAEREHLSLQLSLLPNVTLIKPQKDMRIVYNKTKILFVPSLWNEGYGRVATEAQYSGIPVIASTRGGLPEAVGSGGILIDPNQSVQVWADAVQKLWNDSKYYDELSVAAKTYAERREMQLEHHISMWEKTVETVVNHKKSTLTSM